MRIFLLSALATVPAFAGVLTFSSLASFNTAAGSPAIAVDFDSVAAGTNITGSTLNGVAFSTGGSGAPLIVVNATDTFTPDEFGVPPLPLSAYKLPATSGTRVLSPGGTELGAGPDNPVENDDLTLVFSTPVTAFGLDILFQSYDFAPFVSITAYDQNSNVAFSGSPAVPGSGQAGAPPGFTFWGIVGNNDNPDANVGYDTLRFARPSQVPEPGSLVLLAAGLAALGVLRRLSR